MPSRSPALAVLLIAAVAFPLGGMSALGLGTHNAGGEFNTPLSCRKLEVESCVFGRLEHGKVFRVIVESTMVLVMDNFAGSGVGDDAMLISPLSITAFNADISVGSNLLAAFWLGERVPVLRKTLGPASSPVLVSVPGNERPVSGHSPGLRADVWRNFFSATTPAETMYGTMALLHPITPVTKG